ncbi:MAG: inositol monophosphatase family protein [Bdellovibrionota bacterium]
MFQIEKESPLRLPIIEKILKDSRAISLEGFSSSPGEKPKILSSEHKSGFNDIVTEYDQKVEDFIVSQLKEKFPGEAILGEESAYKIKEKPSDETFAKEELLWVLDPIDGTANYSRSYPYFCTTLALLQKIEGRFKVVIGATLDPVRNEFFHASLGMGAFLNGEKISVSAASEFQKALFVTGFAAERHTQKDLVFKRFIELTRKSLGVRRTGAAALDLAYIACGRLDSYWECGLSAWDVAAGSLLVREAGGVVSHFERSEEWSTWTGEILASNKLMHSQVLAELQRIE